MAPRQELLAAWFYLPLASACRVSLFGGKQPGLFPCGDSAHLVLSAEVNDREWCDLACKHGAGGMRTLEGEVSGDRDVGCGEDAQWLGFLGEKLAGTVRPEDVGKLAGFRQVGGDDVACRWTPKTNGYVDSFYTVVYTHDERGECEARCRADAECQAYEWHSTRSFKNCEIWKVGPVFASLPSMAAQFRGQKDRCWESW